MTKIGILAYGSLIRDPGVEIQPLVAERIATQSPFPVEYARLSRSRGGGPTVVPHTSGKPVPATILVLKNSVSLAEAKNLLWRRETRNEGTGKLYVEGSSPGSVLVKDSPGLQGIGHVLFTDFPPSGKVAHPDAHSLAKAAVASVAKAPIGKDGISYLMQLVESGVETALTGEYCAEVLLLTGAKTLLQAAGWLQANRVVKQLERKLCERAGPRVDARGYFPTVEDNLIPGVHLRQFDQDLRAGAGHELDQKFRAVRSSTALVVNAFAPFKEQPGALLLLERLGVGGLRFEKSLPTGLRGTAPHLDVWLERENGVVGIESKLLEYFAPKKAKFAGSYERAALPRAEDCWWEALEEAKRAGNRQLDVAQLVKHYLGLSNHLRPANGISATLLYLFWEPSNASELAVCRQHRSEIEQLAGKVTNSKVSFAWKSYPELWEEWSIHAASSVQVDHFDLAAHVEHLRRRYSVAL